MKYISHNFMYSDNVLYFGTFENEGKRKEYRVKTKGDSDELLEKIHTRKDRNEDFKIEKLDRRTIKELFKNRRFWIEEGKKRKKIWEEKCDKAEQEGIEQAREQMKGIEIKKGAVINLERYTEKKYDENDFKDYSEISDLKRLDRIREYKREKEIFKMLEGHRIEINYSFRQDLFGGAGTERGYIEKMTKDDRESYIFIKRANSRKYNHITLGITSGYYATLDLKEIKIISVKGGEAK